MQFEVYKTTNYSNTKSSSRGVIETLNLTGQSPSALVSILCSSTFALRGLSVLENPCQEKQVRTPYWGGGGHSKNHNRAQFVNNMRNSRCLPGLFFFHFLNLFITSHFFLPPTPNCTPNFTPNCLDAWCANTCSPSTHFSPISPPRPVPNCLTQHFMMGIK